jgi:hypothetical protein
VGQNQLILSPLPGATISPPILAKVRAPTSMILTPTDRIPLIWYAIPTVERGTSHR